MSDFRRQADGLDHITKVSGEELDHGINWIDFLTDESTGAALTIVTHGFTVPVGINGVSSGIVSPHTVVRLTGGAVGQAYMIVGHVVLSDGQRAERTFVVDVVANKS